MVLRPLILALAIADGVLHLALNFVLFRGNLFGELPFPSPFPLPLNQLFTLNFIGYIVLAILFWFGPQLLGARRWLIDLAMIVYAALSIVGWALVGAPNPNGLGYLSKALEFALIIAAGWHASIVLRGEEPSPQTA